MAGRIYGGDLTIMMWGVLWYLWSERTRDKINFLAVRFNDGLYGKCSRVGEVAVDFLGCVEVEDSLTL